MITERLQIVLVEDQPTDEELFIETLRFTSFQDSQPRICRTLKQAQAALQQQKPDIIILDLNLPDSKGLDTFARIRQEATDVPVIVLTIEQDENVALQALSQGADDYVVKGYFDRIQLEKAIRKALEHNKLQQQLVKTVDDLQRSNKNLEHFAYVTSHDLRGPLTNLLGLLEMYDRSGQKADLNRGLIDKMEVSINTMNGTLHSLIKVLKANEYSDEPLSENQVEKVLEELKVQFSEKLEEARAEVKTDFDDAPSVPFPATKFKSILYNLFSNAIKYRQTQRPLVIQVSTKDQGKFICLSVEDNGVGFDQQMHGKRVFDLFSRVHSGIPGSGIGLYTTKTLLESYGGSIEVDSEKEVGSTFRAYFMKPSTLTYTT